MIVVNRSRRQFLVGTGGFTLALPWLPSLFANTAQAQAYTATPRFVGMATHHGAAWATNMFPSTNLLTNSQNLYSDHQIKSGTLKATQNGSNSSLCTVLTAPSSALSDRIVSKMNVLRGLDMPFYLSHNTGGHLGNYARSDRAGVESDYVSKVGGHIPTIDQVMAWSSTFYKDLGSIKQRSLNIGQDGGLAISWGYSNPQAKSGTVQPVPSAGDSRTLFNSIFVASQPTSAPVNPRTPVVDRVMDAYKKLMAGTFGDATRLSAADKARLDDHMTRLSELERRVNTTASASCSTVPQPTDSANRNLAENDLNGTIRFYRLFNDVIAAAFICGTSRIATIYSDELWSTYAGDWHQEVAHQAAQPDGQKQGIITSAYQQFFEHCFLDLVNKLDVEEANGKTYLDSCIVQWSQESGPSTHDPITMPIIMAGSANGYLNTGVYADYSNKNSNPANAGGPAWQGINCGVLYSQWLATVLQAMGVPPSEFERNGARGYTQTFSDQYYGKGLWPQRLFDDASKPLPFIKT